jgi:hypothetical protein
MDERLLEAWHDELNASCFDGILPRCTFYFGLIRGCEAPKFPYMACYFADSIGSGTIFIHPDHAHDPDVVKSSLAHEMIHQWQDLCGLRLDHRAVFKAWAQHIAQITGLDP